MNFRLRPLLVALLMLSCAAVQAQTSLSLVEAERLALSNAVDVLESQSQAQSLREQAVADAQLPDPALTVGVMSLPVDTLSRRADPMTQLTVGVAQAFPPGDSLQHESARTTQMANAESAQAQLRERELLRDVREAYLEFAYQLQALRVLTETQALLSEVVDISKSLYRVGTATLQDVLSAQLEQSLLDDQQADMQAQRDAALASLQRWTGPLAADLVLDDALVELPQPAEQTQLHAQLETHPMLVEASARVAAGQAGVDVAREQYKPGWMVNVSYGERTGYEPDGMRRSDMLTAMVSMDMPLFTGKRQDKRLAASVGETDALRYARDVAYRDLRRELDTEYSRWQNLKQRESGYAEKIIPAAQHNAEAALTAYRNGVTDFTALLRALLSKHDSRVQQLRTQTDRLLSQARLDYFAGGKP